MPTVSVVQLAPVLGDLDGNHARVCEAVRRAAADVVVVPELATSGYVFADAEEARALARPAAEAVAPWVDVASETGALVAGGFAELGDDGRVYNSAALVDGDGVLAVYRKLHLWDREKLVFAPGQEFPPVVETALGGDALPAAAVPGVLQLHLPRRARLEPRPPGAGVVRRGQRAAAGAAAGDPRRGGDRGPPRAAAELRAAAAQARAA
jgi:hypothetical protein